MSRRASWWALGALAALGVLALSAPLITPYLPDGIDLANRRSAPSLVHLFGTDELGRDVFTRTLFGARVSLAIGVLSAAVTVLIGVAAGATAGYVGGWVDGLIMRFTDAVLSIPRLPLLMIVAAIIEPTVPVLIAMVGLAGWMETARIVRAEFLTLTSRPFVDAARANGVAAGSIILRHLIPNAAPSIAVAATLAVGRGILLESALSFFGVGVQPPQASWGNMLYQAQSTMTTEPWLAVFPGTFIFVSVLSVYVVGDGVGRNR